MISTMNSIIETERLLIRKLNFNDIDILLEFYRKKDNLQYIPNSNFEWTKDKLEKKYCEANTNYDKGYGIYVVEKKEDNAIIGEAGLFNSFGDLKHLELGYILDIEFWKKGYGFEICSSLIAYGFNVLKLKNITSRMMTENIASIKLSEKCGMKLTEVGQSANGYNFCRYEINND